MTHKKIAILCNYKLLPERVGGMDYFFWQFDKKCKENNILVDWFFPNIARHGEYKLLTIFDCRNEVESFFIKNYVNQKYSHVYTHFVELCTVDLKKIKQLTHAKIIVVDHNPRPISGYSLKKKIIKKLKGFLYSRYIDKFIGVSDYSKNQLIKEFGLQIKNKTKVIFNGIEIEKFKQKTNFDFNGKFIVVSHLRPDKGIQDLILAVNEIKNHLKINFTIDIYGKGNHQTFLETLIDEYSLKKLFNFKGSVSNLNELYCQYDYLIHPSHGETFCYSVVESLMSNLPVITTRNQGNVLGLIEDNKNGFLFNEQDFNQLETIIINIIEHKAKINSFLETDLEIKKLSLQNMVNNYFNLLQ